MSGASLALQQAVFRALTDDAALAALIAGRVHDAPPRAPTFPYVTLGQADARDWSTGTEEGREHTLRLYVWSRHAGKSEVMSVLAAMARVLHDQPLTLEGHALVNLRMTGTDARRESDGVTWRGMMRLRAVTEPV